jgi:hypothetical protein
MQAYEHRQFSPWPLAVAGLYGVTVAARKASKRKRRRPNAASVGLALCTLAFCVLNTRVDESGVFWSFGFGFPSGSIPLDDIAHAELTKTKFWEGFGIHWTPAHGWLWNAAGHDAVTIRKRSGGVITIGTDDAAGLYAAISATLPRTSLR